MRKQLERNELIQRNSGLRENTAAEEKFCKGSQTKNNLTNRRGTKHPAWLPDFPGTAILAQEATK